jgi:hypothetical protein
VSRKRQIRVPDARVSVLVEQTAGGRFPSGIAPAWLAIIHPISVMWRCHQKNSTVTAATAEAWPLRLRESRRDIRPGRAQKASPERLTRSETGYLDLGFDVHL